MTRSDFKANAREFSPYPVMVLMADGESICHACARKEARIILSTIRDENGNPESARYHLDSQWLPVEFYAHYEGPPEQCAHCNALIDSAYGDPDSE